MNVNVKLLKVFGKMMQWRERARVGESEREWERAFSYIEPKLHRTPMKLLPWHQWKCGTMAGLTFSIAPAEICLGFVPSIHWCEPSNVTHYEFSTLYHRFTVINKPRNISIPVNYYL